MEWGWLGGAAAVLTAFGTALTLFIRARPEARKIKADGTVALLNATTATSAEQADQIQELFAETRKLWNRQRRTEQLIDRHISWDRRVANTVRDLGGTIEDPPPLALPESDG